MSPEQKTDSSPGCAVVLFLVVLGIGGGLVVLPDLLSCTNKIVLAEAKQNIGVLNRSQQAYSLEHNTFAKSIAALDIGIRTQTRNYNYSIRATKTAAFNYAIARSDYTYQKVYLGRFQWQRRTNRALKSYVGGVFAVPATTIEPKADKPEMLTVAIACEALRIGSATPNPPTLVKGVPTCGAGTRDLRTRK
jgi:type II secretory pathway pseudopilin PulG